MTALAECQLRLDQSVVLDSVATHERIRSTWREIAVTYAASFAVIECVCAVAMNHASISDSYWTQSLDNVHALRTYLLDVS